MSRPTIIECFQEKWNPVFCPKTRRNKALDHFSVSVKHGNALALALAASTCLQIAAAEAGSVTITAMVPRPGDRYVVTSILVTTDGIPPVDRASAQVLYTRLDAVARSLCGGRPNTQEPAWFTKKIEACRRQALDKAVAAIDSPLLSKAAAEK